MNKIIKRILPILCSIPIATACLMGNGTCPNESSSPEHLQVHPFGPNQVLYVSQTPAEYYVYDVPSTLMSEEGYSQPYVLMPALDNGGGGAVYCQTSYDYYELSMDYYTSNSDASMDEDEPFIRWACYDFIMPYALYASILADIQFTVSKNQDPIWRPADNEVNCQVSLDIRQDNSEVTNFHKLTYLTANRSYYSDLFPSAVELEPYTFEFSNGVKYLYFDRLFIDVYFPANAYSTNWEFWSMEEAYFFEGFQAMSDYLTLNELYLDHLTDIAYNTDPTRFMWNTFQGFLTLEFIPGLSPGGLLFFGLVFAILGFVVKLLLHKGD